MSAAPALVLEHEPDAPAALLGAWAAERGIGLEVVSAGALRDPSVHQVAERPFVVSLGSEAAAYDEAVPWLARERAVLDAAIAAAVPVLGICFGAQHLAKALGGTVGPAPHAEVGWLEVQPLPSSSIPRGPWLQWHGDRFEPPPGAELLARSDAGAQAFALGPHLGVQFHPEVDAAIVESWTASFPESLARAGTSAAAVRSGTAHHAERAAGAAFALFDGFLARARMAAPAAG